MATVLSPLPATKGNDPCRILQGSFFVFAFGSEEPVNRAKANRHQRDLLIQVGIDPNEEITIEHLFPGYKLVPIGAYTDEVDLPKDDPNTAYIKELLRRDRNDESGEV